MSSSSKQGANAETLSQQAGEQLHAGRFEAAAALYERALGLDAGRVNDWINRGLALWSLQRPAGALECMAGRWRSRRTIAWPG